MEITREQENFITGNYQTYQAEYILNAMKKDDTIYAPEYALEIFDAWGLLAEEVNPYHNFGKYIIENTNVGRDVVEVSAGQLARLSHRLRSEQIKLGKGTLHVYDKMLKDVIVNENYVVHRENLNELTNLGSASLIVSLKPCKANELVLRRAITENRDFIIGLCDCDHSPSCEFDGYYDLEAYRETLRREAKELMAIYGGELIETVLPGTYRKEIPIWQNVKVKRK